ncbi:beta-Ig-H3/fasciclin [Streptomyces zhihengii]
MASPFLRKAAAAASGAAVAGGLLIVPAGAAQAATAQPTAGGTAPACIGRYVEGQVDGFFVSLSNGCGRTMRVQVVVNSAPDSPCYTLSAGSYRTYTYEGILGTYARTAVC